MLNINFMLKNIIKPAEILTRFYRTNMPVHIFCENKKGDFSRENSRDFPLAKRTCLPGRGHKRVDTKVSTL